MADFADEYKKSKEVEEDSEEDLEEYSEEDLSEYKQKMADFINLFKDMEDDSEDDLSECIDYMDRLRNDLNREKEIIENMEQMEQMDLDVRILDDDIKDITQLMHHNRGLTNPSIDEDNHRPSKRSRVDDEAHEDEHDVKGDIAMYGLEDTIEKHVARNEVRLFIAKKFKKFLLEYMKPKDEQRDSEYVRLIQTMVSANKYSLEIDYNHLFDFNCHIAIWLTDAPQSVLEVMEEAAKEVVFGMDPNFKNIHQTIYIRITNLQDYCLIGGIRKFHLNKMIRIGGVVIRLSEVFPHLQKVKYECSLCGTFCGPFFSNSCTKFKVDSCPECQSTDFLTAHIEQTIYKSYQKLVLLESPGIVPADSPFPRYKEVILLNDLIDCALPGEEIEVTGIYTNNFDLSLSQKNGFPVFPAVVEANYVAKKQDSFSAYKFTQEDKEEIERLAKDPRIGERIIKSIATSIYGHEDVKTAIALAMFGGQEIMVEGHRLRGDINVLLLGDPGTKKSQFLKYVEKTVQRAVYTSGKAASAVGLTAAVHEDPVTGESILEAGALVLADKGIRLIDEFDNIYQQYGMGIHEAMEQQRISISMAGKHGSATSLQARCSVIAAANLIGGRFSQNVEFTDPVVSLFDVLCFVKDVGDPVIDSRLKLGLELATTDDKSINGSRENHEAFVGPVDLEILPQPLLMKYIAYAKLNVFPMLQNDDLMKFTHVYTEMHKKPSHSQGIPIGLRRIKSLVRMSEAHARMHLRQQVTQEDVCMATRVLLHSFISTQEFGEQKALQKIFEIYNSCTRDFGEQLLYLCELDVNVQELLSKAPDCEIDDFKRSSVL